MSLRRELFRRLVNQFPNVSTHALGRLAYNDAPSLFKSQKTAIHAAFRARNGDKHSRVKAHLPKTTFKAGDPFREFPAGRRYVDNWSPIEIAGPCRALVLSDIHIPYHNRKALMAALEFGKKNKANLIMLNGDIVDFFTISMWQKDPRERDLAGEIKLVRQFISGLRDTFPRARIVYKLGNHEERWERYFWVKAPELLGVPDFELDKILGLQPGELISHKEPIRLGNLNVIHGHEYRFAISNPVNPARGLFLRAKSSGLCGHFHQGSQHSEKTVEERNISTWSTGCLCDLHPEYRPLNNWNHGFAFVVVDADGKYEVENKYVSPNGKVY